MKIAYLTPEYPHTQTKGLGGIATSIKNLAQGIIDKGHEVVILVYAQDKDEIFDDNGVTVYKIKNVKFKGLSWYLTRKKIEKIINQLYAEKKIDLVEAPDWTGITSFIQPKKCPIVIKMHGSDTYFCHIEKRPSKPINRFHEKRALQRADGLASVSRFTADYTAGLFRLKREITIIPNSINLPDFTPSGQAVIPDTVLYFGTLIRKKGVLELPFIFNKITEQYPHAKLILAGKDSGDIQTGSTSTWQLMQPLFTEKALENVNYLGAKSYSEIRTIIETAQVCVFPSFAEALPVSWLEAMALEKPVVASDIGWATEMIEDGKEGYLVYPKNHTEYAEKIVALLTDIQKATDFGKNARKRVKLKFQTEIVVQQNIEFYKKIINDSF